MAYRWFCRLDLTDPVPNHSTFSKKRHGRFRDSDLFRHLFESVVARCIAEGLVGGETFASDASLIRADANRLYAAPQGEWDPARVDPAAAPRAVREYLDVLDDAAFGAASEVQPKFTSFADPASHWTGARKGPAFFAYSDNDLIDTDHGVILDEEATRSIRSAEVAATRTMIERTRNRFDFVPERLAADIAYGAGGMLRWLSERQIAPHIPVIDKSERRHGTFANAEFRYDPVADGYTCPGGKTLKKYWRQMKTSRDGVSKDGFRRYYARQKDCRACPLKERCTPTTKKGREMLFAHLKRILRLDRLRLRGPNGARGEFLLAATAQNLRKLAKLIPATSVPA